MSYFLSKLRIRTYSAQYPAVQLKIQKKKIQNNGCNKILTQAPKSLNFFISKWVIGKRFWGGWSPPLCSLPSLTNSTLDIWEEKLGGGWPSRFQGWAPTGTSQPTHPSPGHRARRHRPTLRQKDVKR